jgi:hypothetical protein
LTKLIADETEFEISNFILSLAHAHLANERAKLMDLSTDVEQKERQRQLLKEEELNRQNQLTEEERTAIEERKQAALKKRRDECREALQEVTASCGEDPYQMGELEKALMTAVEVIREGILLNIEKL